MKGVLVPAGLLLLAGLVEISSISISLFATQLVWAALGILLVVLFYIFDWRAIFNYRWFTLCLYGAGVALLVAAYFTAPVIRNTRSWLVLGPLNFQPAELVKICLILLYAEYFSRRHVSIARWANILGSFVYFIVPAALIMLQPDLGSALVIFGIWFGFLVVVGLPRRRFLAAVFGFAVAGALLWNYGLEAYQRERVMGVFYPERDVLGVNYSVAQSKIAIGSAGFWGKGYGQGSQTQLGFLPEPANDFIFSAFVEEWGWVFGAALIAAFFALIVGILKVGYRADRNVEKLICLGAAILFAWQFFLNIGSATGMLPVVGVTFPFVSYGGSSLLTSLFLVAIINAIAVRS